MNKFRLFYFDQWGGKSVIYPENDRYLIGLNGMVYENYGKSWKEPLWESVFDAAQPPIISRFTGLKDKNGKDIYEFDILKWDKGWMYPEMNGEIKWIINGWYFKNKIVEWLLEKSIDAEILGNIHENSNLLK